MLIEKGKAVVIGYELKLDSGDLVDSADKTDPLTFIFGAGQMLPAFEKQLAGKKKGDKAAFSLTPDEGYGQKELEAIMKMPRKMFPDHVAEGMIFEAESPDGHQALLRVTTVGLEEVTVDANHPMAGENLHFSVEVFEVREPSPDDMSDDDHHHDHEHGPGCSH